MRIVAGQARGRLLAAPRGTVTRPTPDRVREALFSSLGDVTGRRVLDGYAGSGALGLEALSRGARHVLFVERDRVAFDAVGRNLDAVGLAGGRARREDLGTVLEAGPDEPYDLVLLDPPYADPVEPVLALLLRRGWLGPGADVVVERATRDLEPSWPKPLVPQRSRRYGETTLWYLRSP